MHWEYLVILAMAVASSAAIATAAFYRSRCAEHEQAFNSLSKLSRILLDQNQAMRSLHEPMITKDAIVREIMDSIGGTVK